MQLLMRPYGYTLLLSAQDTRDWAHKPGAVWPASKLSGLRLQVFADETGLVSYATDEPWTDVPYHEITACVADFLPAVCREFWPVWGGAHFD